MNVVNAEHAESVSKDIKVQLVPFCIEMGGGIPFLIKITKNKNGNL